MSTKAEKKIGTAAGTGQVLAGKRATKPSAGTFKTAGRPGETLSVGKPGQALSKQNRLSLREAYDITVLLYGDALKELEKY